MKGIRKDRIEFEERMRDFLAERDYEFEHSLDDSEGHMELGLDTLVDAEGWNLVRQRLFALQHLVDGPLPQDIINCAPNARQLALASRVREWRNHGPQSPLGESWMSDILYDTRPEYREQLKAAMLRWDEALSGKVEPESSDMLDELFGEQEA